MLSITKKKKFSHWCDIQTQVGVGLTLGQQYISRCGRFSDQRGLILYQLLSLIGSYLLQATTMSADIECSQSELITDLDDHITASISYYYIICLCGHLLSDFADNCVDRQTDIRTHRQTIERTGRMDEWPNFRDRYVHWSPQTRSIHELFRRNLYSVSFRERRIFMITVSIPVHQFRSNFLFLMVSLGVRSVVLLPHCGDWLTGTVVFSYHVFTKQACHQHPYPLVLCRYSYHIILSCMSSYHHA